MSSNSVILSAADEARLVQESLGGDERAFGALVKAYQKVLFNLAVRIVRNHEDALDLTQTVFVKAYRKLGSFDRHHKFFSWIYRIMLNESLSLRARRRLHEPLDDRIVAPQAAPDEQHIQKEACEMVRNAVMELSPGDRDTIVLRHFLGLSHREMSDFLGIPEKTVKSRLHSARHKLGGILKRAGILS